MTENKNKTLNVDLSESIGMEMGQITHMKIQMDPQIPEHNKKRQHSVQGSIISDQTGKKIDLGQSIAGQSQQNQFSQGKQQKKLIPVDFFYDQDHQQTTFQDSPITSKLAQLYECFGFDSYKRYNIQILDRDHIIFASGITYTIYNHFTQQKKVFFSKDKGGIGSIAVHPDKKYFAVAEKGDSPNIYVYEFPSLRLYRILRKGTQKSFSNISFSKNGKFLASVGSYPDYLLCVWDWSQEIVVLKSKAFSQQIYKTTFYEFNQNALVTSGIGHIKFWKIAQTFTGLKLQGQIAKFGQIQLSDVSAFVDFQDGKILSSSQYGKLLLWEGNLIKCVISINQETPCHNGPIQVIILRQGKIITAGVDGYIRFWDYQVINQSESDQKFNYYLKPLKQIYLERSPGIPSHILTISTYLNFWIVQDAKGKIWKFTLPQYNKQLILETNSGKFNDMAVSPINNCVVTAGYDGYIRLWDYGNRRQLYAKNFKTISQATCIEWLPYNKRNSGRMLSVGFSDGILRFVVINQTDFALAKALKLHKKKIVHVKCSPDASMIATIDEQGDIFLTSLSTTDLQKIKPYCLYETGFKVNDVCWDRNSKKLLVGCKDGKIHEIMIAKQHQCDFSETYLRKFQFKSYTIKMMQSQKPKREDLELELLLKKTKGGNVEDKIVDQQWEPSPILNLIYYDSQCTKILCSVDGKFLGMLYIIDINKQRPINAITVSKQPTSFLGFESQDLLVIGLNNGGFNLRHRFNYEKWMKKQPHDRDYGRITKICFNFEKNAIISASQDGTLFVHKFDYNTFIKAAKSSDSTIDDSAITLPGTIHGINEVSFIQSVQLQDKSQQDIKDNTVYSIQQQKLKAEQDNKLSEAEKTKRKKLAKIKQLQNLFKEIVQTNKAQSDQLAKLTQQQLVVDPQYLQILHNQVEQQYQQTKKQLLYDELYYERLKQKIKKYMIDQLEFDIFKVHGLKQQQLFVQSFKLKKMSNYMVEELKKIEQIINMQRMIQEQQIKQSANQTRNNFNKTKEFLATKTDLKQTQNSLKKKQQYNKDVKNKIREAEADFQKQLALAIATKGDYKLKSAKDYIVPEQQRMNVSKKKKHMFLHYQFLFNSKKKFNENLVNLKSRRQHLVNKIKLFNKRFMEINTQLGISEELFFPTIQRKVSLEEVNNQEIEEFAKQKAKQKQIKKGTGMGGMGGMGGMSSNQVKQEKKQKQRKKSMYKEKQEKPVVVEKIKGRKGMKVQVSNLEQQLKQINQIKLLAQKDKMKKQLQKQIKQFDEDLQNLKTTKNYLEMDLRLVEMKLITYYQEFIIFRDMEQQDNRLLEHLNNLKRDKDNYQETSNKLINQIIEVQNISEDLKKKLEEEKKIFKELVFPQDDQKREKILKYYKNRERKRLLKAKKQSEKQVNEQEGSQNQQQQNSQSQQEQEDQFDEDQQKPDITPIQTDHKNFDLIRKMCQHDEKIEQNAKLKSDYQKQKNQIATKIKNILVQLQKAETQLRLFQRKKLLKVNQLDVSYPIKFQQIEYLIKSGETYNLPEDLSSSILFTYSQSEKLNSRIRELKKQKSDIEKKQLILQKQLSRLKSEVTKASIEIQNKKKQYQEKQLLKFGDIIDLKILDALEPTKQVLQMRQRYKIEQKQASRKVQQIKHKLQLKKKDLLNTKKQNTKIITEITELGQKQMQLNKKLDSTNKQLFKGDDEDKKNDLDKQKQNLKDLIKFLSKEIQDLKTQIGLFKRKGGHIYTMVTSNKRNFS